MLNVSESLGKLAAENPSATSVFLRYQLDFCCGGGQSLEEACRESGLDPAKVALEIEREVPDGGGEQRWDRRSIEDLIDHILVRYHEPLHRDLPGLVRTARRVEVKHREKPTCPHGLAAHLDNIHAAVESHLAKEEQILFPLLRAGADGRSVHMPIRIMMQEHDDHGANLRHIRELTADFTLPSDACASWKALYAELEKLERDLMEHIHLENNVLFPRALNG